MEFHNRGHLLKKHHIITQILRIGCFIFLFSRGLLYLIFDSPLRALLWHEKILRPFIELAGFSWTEYANVSNLSITIIERLIGVFLMVTSCFFLTINQETKSKLQFRCIVVAGIFTLLHILLKYLGHNQELPILPEYILQGFCPWIFLSLLKYMPAKKDELWKYPSDLVIIWCKFTISMCFIGHGLYAAGWPYQPASFVRMLSHTFLIDYKAAAMLVTCVGIIDIALGITVFIKPLEKISLGHMAFWGFVTAGARVMCYVIVPMKGSNINPWLFETSVRTMHGALPLVLLLIILRVKQEPQPIDWDWLKKRLWQMRLPAFVCMIIFIVLYTFQNSSNLEIEQKRQLTLEQNKQKLRSAHKPQGRSKNLPADPQATEFSQSASGEWFSDELFANEFFPVRLLLDASSPEQLEMALKGIKPFYHNRKFILERLRQEVLNSYRNPQKNRQVREFPDEQILGFIKKTIFTMDGGENLTVRIYAPWLREKSFSLEFNQREFL